MSQPSCAQLVESYVDWLRQGLLASEIDGVCEITTPFLDRHNDHLQIYVEGAATGLRLTDDGYILADLKASGIDLPSSARRSEILATVTAGFGVGVEQGELVAYASEHDFPRKKHNLLQAMLAVNDLFVLAKPHVTSIFREDVETFLTGHDVRFSPAIGIPGRSGLDQHFHLVIPASKDYPERLVESVNKLTRQRLPSLVFQWTDVRPNRPGAQMVVFLNDEEGLRDDLVSALRAYEIWPIAWSHRDEHLERLVA